MRAKAFALTVCIAVLPSLGWAADTAASPDASQPASQPASQAASPAVAQAASPSDPSSSEVVATQAGAPGSPNQPADPQLTRWLQQAPSVSLGDDYQSGAITQTPKRGVHGEVGFSVGSGGYRDAYGVVTMPIGKTGELGVAVEDTQFNKPFRVHARSLDVSLALGGASAGGAPADCASAIRVGDRYVEPLWATRIRGSALQDVDPRCVSADPSPR
ncbi:MAG: hypothetical protein P4L73_19945 [Caulobacteraceae bacterium]|nr:hypothetical protein [Caulobacteraceae bacterium]